MILTSVLIPLKYNQILLKFITQVQVTYIETCSCFKVLRMVVTTQLTFSIN